LATGLNDPTVSSELERKVQQQTFPLAKQVSEALLGALFPLRRDLLVWVARENEAPPTLVSLFSGLPDRVYRSLDEVQEAVDQSLARVSEKP